MKSTIQQEAEKAAKKIREALEEFNRVTDLSAGVSVTWHEGDAWGQGPAIALGEVALCIHGFEVKA